MNLNVLENPRGNYPFTSGLYYGDKKHEGICLITGIECDQLDRTEGEEVWFDCRTCNIPIVAAICRLSRTIGANGRE